MSRPAFVVLSGLLMVGCSAPGPAPRSVLRPISPAALPPAPAAALPRLGFTIQAGAFAKVENASRLADALQARGLDAVYYAAQKDLYRVRFGDFPTREAARTRAEALKEAGVIREFYLVAPREPALARPMPGSEGDLRANLVETAQSYLGVPYLWGGTTAGGFDCSGLAMAVYRLNGLQLPRTSRDQFAAGEPVPLERLRPGDLVFFAATRGGGVAHVGIYLGQDAFIHAPGRDRRITRDHVTEPWFRERFLGGRSYLG